MVGQKNYVCVHTQYTITNAHTCAHCVEKREDDNISNYKDIRWKSAVLLQSAVFFQLHIVIG